MQSTGAINQIASESVGPWETSKITISKGSKAKVTITFDDSGNPVLTLTGGATVSS